MSTWSHHSSTAQVAVQLLDRHTCRSWTCAILCANLDCSSHPNKKHPSVSQRLTPSSSSCLEMSPHRPSALVAPDGRGIQQSMVPQTPASTGRRGTIFGSQDFEHLSEMPERLAASTSRAQDSFALNPILGVPSPRVSCALNSSRTSMKECHLTVCWSFQP